MKNFKDIVGNPGEVKQWMIERTRMTAFPVLSAKYIATVDQFRKEHSDGREYWAKYTEGQIKRGEVWQPAGVCFIHDGKGEYSFIVCVMDEHGMCVDVEYIPHTDSVNRERLQVEVF